MHTSQQTGLVPRWMTFLLVAVVGLFYVKWFPYYNRAFVAAADHSIGSSILMGNAAAPPVPSWDAAFGYAWAYGNAIWKAMVLGLLLGSGIQALLPADWVARTLGRTGFGSVVAAGVLSMPSMMCTCCAAPVVVGLRERQASPGAAIAFWLGNTVLNPATLVFTGFVLGWNWTALRLALGIPMVFGLGYLVNLMVTPTEARASEAKIAELEASTQATEGPGASNAFLRWIEILTRMSVRLIPEYVVIVLLLGAARAWLFPEVGPEIGNEIGWIVALAAAGMLFVDSDGRRGADHPGDAVARNGRRASGSADDNAAARQRRLASDGGALLPPACSDLRCGIDYCLRHRRRPARRRLEVLTGETAYPTSSSGLGA